jgi:drug/metabolite transporter (DMT)-like permease
VYSGIPFALASAALFGMSTPLAKMLVGEVSPLLLAGLLYAGSGVGLLLVAAGRQILTSGRSSVKSGDGLRQQSSSVAWRVPSR